MTKTKSSDTVKVGGTVDLDPVAGMVRLPDGTVTTTRGPYTPTVEGEHTFLDGAGKRIKAVTVAPARPSTRRAPTGTSSSRSSE